MYISRIDQITQAPPHIFPVDLWTNQIASRQARQSILTPVLGPSLFSKHLDDGDIFFRPLFCPERLIDVQRVLRILLLPPTEN